ncbi:CarboxypepD_reg-like domain-containing protein [Flavobacterium omnivorum]|uniref:CarboxypepD_reg-like domain-containing protein n=1 Tax=Flavobacterium omnivorum TaxID=178355 RepID=A0A1G7WTG9_9FLAO|nr:carboxypeptidase-like regulatory domain-containing protein [Flavobacterium omnivorum]SDG75265.1 CarboxypepD_reg-like domain-containing protein [Flavobacterium omnivorum]
MKTYTGLLFFSLFLTSYSYSQITGKCVDNYGIGIPYVNISIKGKSIGTVSNISGNFFIENSSINEKDSLIFSHLNFEKKTKGISFKTNEIQLDSKVENLKEVVVSSKKRKVKEKIVGTKTASDNIVTYYSSNHLGTEIGKIITVKKNKIYDLKSVQFNIPDFQYKSTTFRINFYNITNDTIHLLKVNGKDNVIKVTKSGMVKFDLSDQDLSFENNFLVAIEWIDFENNGNIENEYNMIKFSSTVFSGPYVSRDNVNIEWENKKLPLNIGIGIHLKVNEYSN